MTTEAGSLRHGATVRQRRQQAARRRVEWMRLQAKHEEYIRQWQWQREASLSAIAMCAEEQDKATTRRIGFLGLLRRLFDRTSTRDHHG